MGASAATTVEACLDALPAGRREPIAAMRAWVRRQLPAGFDETMAFGMIAWQVPLARYPQTYNGKALMRAGLAGRKRYAALYLSCAGQDPDAAALLREGARREGKKLDMGRSCIRFRSPGDLPLEALAALLRGLSVDAFIAGHERARAAAGVRPGPVAPARRAARTGARP